MTAAGDVRAPGERDWRGRQVCVAGMARSGEVAARVLAELGAEVTVADARLGTDEVLPEGADLVVTSPGWRPTHPLFAQAAARGVEVWGEVELAWRLADRSVPWLGVTGTNGKTTTVQMLESVLRAAGHRAVACGNVGLPVLEAVTTDPPYDVLAVEMSSFQLHWARTVEFAAAAVLNLAPDHLDWHGSMEAYAEAKASIWRGNGYAVYNADDEVVSELAARRDSAVGFTLGPPRDGVSFGIADDTLAQRATGLVELARVADVHPAAPHNLANALAAAALATSLDPDGRLAVPPSAVAQGLRDFAPGAHRIAVVGTVDGVAYVDDSKATNPHAAGASLAAFDSVVWIAGGLAKGVTFDDLVRGAADRLRGVVLMGQDRAVVADALARHAPQVPVVDVPRTDTGAMDDVVGAARGLARPGDTVLLAPACASMDMFTDYAARGDAFAAAVEVLVP